jgi:hypothetical protein
MTRNRLSRALKSPMQLYASGSASLLAVQLLWLLLATPSLQAQTFTVLHAFTGKGDGEGPSAGVIRGPSGSLYGVTEMVALSTKGRSSRSTPKARRLSCTASGVAMG